MDASAPTVAEAKPNPLVRRFETVHGLSPNDQAALTAICERRRRVEAGQDVIAQGSPPRDVHLLLDGFAIRYKMLPDGGRQIVGLLVPGDFCDLHVAILGAMDHSIAALTACMVVNIPPATIHDLIEHRSGITGALWWASLVDKGTLREWLTNLGRREAVEQLAHLFCELRLRLGAVGLVETEGYDLPLRQHDLADMLGLTNVHVNRSLRVLRRAGLIALERRRLTIPDVAALEAFCAFDPVYLHLGPRGR